jgi:branched-chain amino acid transport system ATP-binding protein
MARENGIREQEAILILENLVKDFGGLRATNDVSLSVQPGERRAIIGPNGAGKTTLFKLITGELALTAGRIFLKGKEITRLPPHRRIAAGLARTYQITNVFPGLTVEENVQLAAQGLSSRKFVLFRGIARQGEMHSRVVKALADVGLTAVRDVPVKELSYGEQRQLEIALALAGNPSVLLLDEPAAGLSSADRVQIGHLIRALPRDLTIVLIEHDMDLALGLVDHVTCLHYGAVIASDTPERIRANPEIQEIYLGAG